VKPARLDLALYAGDDYALALSFTDPTGAAIDLSGRTYRAQIRASLVAESPPASFTIGLTQLGVVTLTLARAVTAVLPRSGVWDLEETGVDGKVATVLAGTVAVTRDVTR
jgi:hypothetical protein